MFPEAAPPIQRAINTALNNWSAVHPSTVSVSLLPVTDHCPVSPAQSGVVRSVKESLNSQFVESCKGVVQRLTLQEHKMVWNRTTHFW